MEFDLTYEQQTELLQTLWNIMSTFVDIGWGVDTVQMCLPELFDADNQDGLAMDSKDLLDSDSTRNKYTSSTVEKGTSPCQ